ncbi:MAG: Chromate resistance protein ChrB [Candidatus Cryosericum sp.]
MMTWLTITYKVPTEPSRTRVYLWRKLKELGAVYVQQGAAILPLQDALVTQVRALKSEVASGGGEMLVGRMEFIDEEDDARVVAAFQQQRNSDYDEIVEQCERLIYELDRETEKEKYTYAEIEENETELTRIHKWMERIVARDWFSAPGRRQAEQAIEEAEKRSSLYTEEVERRQGHATDVNLPGEAHF